jgi:P4 family phage/plasmid primase-like protien
MVGATDVFDSYLKTKHAAKSTDHTHTRIGSKDLHVAGGSYVIPLDEQDSFLGRYYEKVWGRGIPEYLTERQQLRDGPVLVDIDLRYSTEIETRQHHNEHVLDAIILYAEKIAEMLNVENGQMLQVYVLQKKNVNRLDVVTKDGIHIIFGVQMHKALQCQLRNEVLVDLPTMWDDLPITNSWDEVLDEGVTKGCVNWQLYGSRKPGNEPYCLCNSYTLVRTDGDWEVQETQVSETSIKDELPRLSARYTKWPKWNVQDTRKDECDGLIRDFQTSSKRRKHVVQTRLPVHNDPLQYMALLRAGHAPLIDEAALDEMLDELYSDSDNSDCDYSLKEAHLYTMCLPKAYYGPGSYNNWMRVGWALANTSKVPPARSPMFLTWIKFSSQEPRRNTLCGPNGKFDWGCVAELYAEWREFEFDNPGGLTNRSIMYWARQHAPAEYEKVRMSTVHFFIEQSIITATEFDLASVLYHMYKHQFVCVSIKNNMWYEYTNHRWYEIDSGNSLRMHISKEVHAEYLSVQRRKMRELDHMEQGDAAGEVRNSVKRMADIMLALKTTMKKNNIMREARELFYDREFIKKLDQNPYLLCFTNCVVDFQTKTHRKGQPDDYISMCTQIPYSPFTPARDHAIKEELDCFMSQLFPHPELRGYMWEHLASSLVGTTDNQTFNQYTGSGRNGKSKLVDFMSKCLGDYKATVPITLITQKRNTIGSTSSEVAQLMGVRYAVMQEPSEGDKINAGILKEITGGDPIQARALFKDSVTFNPQFNLVVCTNHSLEVQSQDDGTWRRMRYVPFDAKFIDNPGEDPQFPIDEYPHQFKLDKRIEDNFATWAPVFMSILVELAMETKGYVADCDVVKKATEEYRNNQDFIAGFIAAMIVVKPISTSDGDTAPPLRKSLLSEKFRAWYVSEGLGKTLPPLSVGKLTSELNRRFPTRVRSQKKKGDGWVGLALADDEDYDQDPMLH